MDFRRFFRGPIFWIVLAVFGVLLVGQVLTAGGGFDEADTSQVIEQIEAGNARSVKLVDRDQRLEVTLTNGDRIESDWVTGQGPDLVALLTEQEQAGNLPEGYDIEVPTPSFLLSLIGTLFPFILIVLIFLFLMNQMQGGGSKVMQFGKSKAKLISKDTPKTTFADVAGADEAVEELHEIKEFLQDPGKFQAVGAKIPKGVLLYGAPGTGKTLLARAVAGEAEVPFYSISGSDFVEMFVGVGASVTGDTPVLIKDAAGARLVPIGEYVDEHYQGDAEGFVVRADDVETLGYEPRKSGFRGRVDGFAGSAWKSVGGVYRHKVDEIYEIHFLGGMVRTTGDHSVFVRGHGGIKAKPTSELRVGEVLVDLPYKTRRGFRRGHGTEHDLRAHKFNPAEAVGYLEIGLDRGEYADASAGYDTPMALAGSRPQSELAELAGVSQMTISNWTRGRHQPRAISDALRPTVTPTAVPITPSLLKVLGYYTAEGRVNGGVEFCFGSHELDLLADCTARMQEVFGLQPRVEHTSDNTTRLIYASSTLGRTFAGLCGSGSKAKHVPEMLWTLPREHFLAFLEGYALGDGHLTSGGKLELTSTSQQLIRELAWLCAMHGIKAGLGHGTQVGGRVIKMTPLPAGEYWRLTIGATSNPFHQGDRRNEHKRPVITEIVRKPHDGYVYDLCGVENEAFFGGQKPLLLHNSRVRDLFEQAKANAPAIVFVDEIDAVGRHRGAGLGGGHDEREQTLNQLLVEMDGFDVKGGVILIAATNRPDILDPALLRPGRFDRQIAVDPPDLTGRHKILQVHSKGKPMAQDVDLLAVARRTPGFTGADLANVLNEAALLTARHNGKLIVNASLDEAIDRVVAGPQRRTRLMNDKEKKITAYHEGGHALVAAALPNIDPVHKVTILPRGGALGFTMVLPDEDKYSTTRNEMLDQLSYAMGGRAAEELVFHDPTTGAANDIEKATKLARAMVTKYGMTERLGAIKFGQERGEVFLGRDVGHERDYSEQVAGVVDEEVRRLVEAAHFEAYEILAQNRSVLDELVLALFEKETLNRTELATIFSKLRKRGPRPAWTGSDRRLPSDRPPVLTPKELAAVARGESVNGHPSMNSPAPTDVPEQPVPRPQPGPLPEPGSGGLES